MAVAQDTAVIEFCNDEQAKANEKAKFFEGAEKLLEVWFDNNAPGAKPLRGVPKFEWDAMLELAHCQVISVISNEFFDSYLLSESSMFVSDWRYILKTCGTTKLMDTLGRLFELAQEYCSLNAVQNVFYSRKNFTKPELQSTRHRDFSSEMDHLDQFFPEDGQAYCLGSLKQDRWYLYTLNPPRGPLPLLGTQNEANLTPQSGKDRQRYDKAGIDKLLPPGTKIDEFLFDPCGYSMNALLPDSDQYATIHVTPEPTFSYVSFETNQNVWSMYEQTMKVLDCFNCDYGSSRWPSFESLPAWTEGLPLVLAASTLVLYVTVKLAPDYVENQPAGGIDQETTVTHAASFKFPASFDQAKQLAAWLILYREQHYIYLVVVFSIAYLYKQTFAIPGSAVMNVLAGAVFGPALGLTLVSVLTTIGASLCYTLSEHCGRELVQRYLTDRLAHLRNAVAFNRHRLFYFLLSARLFPASPNWLLNVCSPHLAIPLPLFAASVLIGLTPYHLVCVHAGEVLGSVHQLADIFDTSTVVRLALTAGVAFAFGILSSPKGNKATVKMPPTQ